ncbi:hypothetical protein [Phenylobacterium sp.]|jgi:hypothetical protein|uniref:hypothetical protein n=1 Tax=Phenylobacterium sp. TaxID=1871053 RepID=UPI0037CC2D5F
MMFRAFTHPSAPPPLAPARHPNGAGGIAPQRPRPDRLSSLLSAERAGEVGLETLMRVL